MDDLDAAIALVYGQPPSGFVAARSALVKELRAAKRRDEAARVAALRRPTKLAWALGEAVRTAPDAAGAYFAAVDALAGPGGDLRQRAADLRSAVAALVDGAEGVDPGEATAALLATAADPDATAALRRGRLAEVPAAGGFGLTGFEVPAAVGQEAGEDTRPAPPVTEELASSGEEGAGGGTAAPDEGHERTDSEAAAEREREEQARAERLVDLEAEREAAEGAVATATADVEAATAAVAAAEAELERASRVLDAAREAAAAVSERLREARAEERGAPG